MKRQENSFASSPRSSLPMRVFFFELAECRHKRSANHQWQKTVAPQRAAVPGSMGNWFVSYTEEVGAPKIGG